MAAIWRGFLILGNPLCNLPDEEVKMLEELRDLYKRTISVNSSLQESTAARSHEVSDGQNITGQRQAQPPNLGAPKEHEHSPNIIPRSTRQADANHSECEAGTRSGVDLVCEQCQSGDGNHVCQREAHTDSGYWRCDPPISQVQVHSASPSKQLDSIARSTMIAKLPKCRPRKEFSSYDDDYQDSGSLTKSPKMNEERIFAIQHWIQECTP